MFAVGRLLGVEVLDFGVQQDFLARREFVASELLVVAEVRNLFAEGDVLDGQVRLFAQPAQGRVERSNRMSGSIAQRRELLGIERVRRGPTDLLPVLLLGRFESGDRRECLLLPLSHQIQQPQMNLPAPVLGLRFGSHSRLEARDISFGARDQSFQIRLPRNERNDRRGLSIHRLNTTARLRRKIDLTCRWTD